MVKHMCGTVEQSYLQKSKNRTLEVGWSNFRKENMKKVEFTQEELRTLIWAIQNQHAASYMQCFKNGEKPSDNETIQRLNEISKKAYSALMNN